MQAKMSNISFLIANFTASLEVSTCGCLAQQPTTGHEALLQPELPPAWFCRTPYTPVLSSQDV